jgi:hypothetical protein
MFRMRRCVSRTEALFEHTFVRFTSGFVLLASCATIWRAKDHLRRHVRAVHEKLKEYQCVLCHLLFSQQVHLDQHVRAVHEKIRAFSVTLPKIVHSSQLIFVSHEKRKEHQLRLMNGGGDDDFFFNNNNTDVQRIRQQRRL